MHYATVQLVGVLHYGVTSWHVSIESLGCSTLQILNIVNRRCLQFKIIRGRVGNKVADK